MSLAPIARGHQATELKTSKRSERKTRKGEGRKEKEKGEKREEERGKKYPYSQYKPIKINISPCKQNKKTTQGTKGSKLQKFLQNPHQE